MYFQRARYYGSDILLQSAVKEIEQRFMECLIPYMIAK